VRAPVDAEPPTALLPAQAPEAVQDVALAVDQVNVLLPPPATVLGLAARLTVGAGFVTDTVADWTALPPAPLQLSVKVSSAVRSPVDCEPFNALLPTQAPEPVQEVELTDDQASVEPWPLATVLGLALKVMLGAGAVTETVTDWVALLPFLLQVRI